MEPLKGALKIYEMHVGLNGSSDTVQTFPAMERERSIHVLKIGPPVYGYIELCVASEAISGDGLTIRQGQSVWEEAMRNFRVVFCILLPQ